MPGSDYEAQLLPRIIWQLTSADSQPGKLAQDEPLHQHSPRCRARFIAMVACEKLHAEIALAQQGRYGSQPAHGLGTTTERQLLNQNHADKASLEQVCRPGQRLKLVAHDIQLQTMHDTSAAEECVQTHRRRNHGATPACDTLHEAGFANAAGGHAELHSTTQSFTRVNNGGLDHFNTTRPTIHSNAPPKGLCCRWEWFDAHHIKCDFATLGATQHRCQPKEAAARLTASLHNMQPTMISTLPEVQDPSQV